MKVLVTGGEGYVGSLLVPMLLKLGYDVAVLDSNLYGARLEGHARLTRIVGDVRAAPDLRRAMEGANVVVHLAAIVGDEACGVDPYESRNINEVGTERVATEAVWAGAERLVFASTCSVYGSQAHPSDEDTPCRPLSIYAESKVDAERALHARFPLRTVLRFGTLYGISPRPRFDLAVNVMSARAASGRNVHVVGPGLWRAFTHVYDAARSVAACISSPVSDVAGKTFNVAFYNCTLHSLGLEIADCVPGAEIVEQDAREDIRTYQVISSRISRDLGFQPVCGLRDGIREIADSVRAGLDYEDERYDNATWLGRKRGGGKA